MYVPLYVRYGSAIPSRDIYGSIFCDCDPTRPTHEDAESLIFKMQYSNILHFVKFIFLKCEVL